MSFRMQNLVKVTKEKKAFVLYFCAFQLELMRTADSDDIELLDLLDLVGNSVSVFS